MGKVSSNPRWKWHDKETRISIFCTTRRFFASYEKRKIWRIIFFHIDFHLQRTHRSPLANDSSNTPFEKKSERRRVTNARKIFAESAHKTCTLKQSLHNRRTRAHKISSAQRGACTQKEKRFWKRTGKITGFRTEKSLAEASELLNC